MLFQNLSKFLEDPRRRNIIMVTLLVLLTMLLIGSIRVFHYLRGKGFSSIAKIDTMQSIHSVPGGMKQVPSKAYTNLQIEQNKQNAEKAKQKGHSAIATIVDHFDIPKPNQSHWTEDASAFKKQPFTPYAPLSEAERTVIDHQQFMSQQHTELSKQQLQSAMQQQMNQLFNTWSRSPTQEQIIGISEPASELAHSPHQVLPAPLLKAGAILQATLLTEVNSDEPSPVLAKITTGKFQEGYLIGTVSLVGERLLLKFHTLNLKNSETSLPIHAVAVDPVTAKTSLSSEVDRHHWLRYSALLGGSFLQGFGTVFQSAGNGLIYHPTDQGGFFTRLNPTGQLLSATGNVGTHFGAELAQKVHRPPTVCVHAGTPIGILFSSDLIDAAHS